MAAGDRFDVGGRVGESGLTMPTGVVLLAAALAALLLSPLLWVLMQATQAGLGTAVQLLTSSDTLSVLVNTLALVGTVTVGSILLGVPMAVLTAGSDLPGRRVWTIGAALPLVVPSYIGAFAFVSAFGPRGVLQDLLSPLGVESIPTIYGFHGAALVLTLFVFPYVFLTTRAALLSFDWRLLEAARTLNHDRWQAFRKVVVPQLVPAISAGALLVALYTLSDFGTPAIMQYDVFTRVIYVEYSNPGVNGLGKVYAALLSVQLVVVTLGIVALESQVGSDDGDYVSRGASRTGHLELGRLKWPAVAFCAFVTLLCLGLPLGILVMWLFRAGPGYSSAGFSFQLSYAWNSLGVAGLAALVSLLVALPVGYLSARSDSTLARLSERATYVGYAVPGVVLGLALVYFGLRASAYLPFLYQSIPLLVFAYVVRFVPQAVGAVRSSVLQVDDRLVEASRSLGFSPATSFRKVVLPNIAPGMAAGAALVFLTTMKELPATLMLSPPGFDTFVTYIWLVQGTGYYGQAAVPALVLVGVSGLSMLVILARERINVD
jgi:iron(III) transport system permease protein